jgi:hypothetical protein
MATSNVFEWGMHAPGTSLQFAARRNENAYEVVIQHDETVVMTYRVPDGGTVLRKSQELRSQLQRLGYSPKPRALREPAFSGGPCWGPAQPLESSILQVLLS